MKALKFLFSLLWRLAVLALCVFICREGLRRVTGYYNEPPLVGLVALDSELQYVDIDSVRSAVEAEGLRFEQTDFSMNLNLSALSLLDKGANVLVFCTDGRMPAVSTSRRAMNEGVTIIFIGDYRHPAIFDNYDKVWFIENNSAHGAELLGKAMALASREGVVDKNGNQLADYTAIIPLDYPRGKEILENAMLECEHYGVYSHQISLLQPTRAEVPGYAHRWSGADEVLDEEGNVVAEAVKPISQPELIVAAGCEAASEASRWATELGWRVDNAFELAEDNASTTIGEDGEEIAVPSRMSFIGAVVENEAEARRLMDAGEIDFAAWYDETTVTNLVSRLCINSANKRYAAQDCALQPDDEKVFVLGYQTME